MTEYINKLVIDESNSYLLHPIDHNPASLHPLTWYGILYLAGILLTNGLAGAVHNILHNIL